MLVGSTTVTLTNSRPLHRKRQFPPRLACEPGRARAFMAVSRCFSKVESGSGLVSKSATMSSVGTRTSLTT